MENKTELIALITAGCLAMLFIILIVFTFFVVHRKKILEKETKIIEIEHVKQMEIIKAASDAEEKQKVGIARDLHDGIGASLGAVIRSIDKNIKDFENNKFNIDRMKNDLRTIEQAYADIRNVSHNLIPPNVVVYGLIKALGYHMNTIKNLSGSRADFENNTSFEEAIPVSMPNQVNAFRICQELINNLLKHAKYNYLKVSVESDLENLIIDFIHDGTGISNDEIRLISGSTKGLGLNSVFSRVMLINGTIDYSIEKEAATINLKIPFTE